MSVHKFHPMLAETVQAATEGEEIRVIVRYRTGISGETVRARAVPAGGQVRHVYRRIPARAMTLRAGDVAESTTLELDGEPEMEVLLGER